MPIIDLPDFARNAINLAQPRLGTEVVYATDDFFADKARLIDPAEPSSSFPANMMRMASGWTGGKTAGANGRPATTGATRLGVPGLVAGLEIDTRHFTGNYPPGAEIEAALTDDPMAPGTTWREIVPASPLGPSAHHFIEVKDRAVYNSLRLNIYPDGGVARLRVYGEPVAQWDGKDRNAVYELSNIANGGRILAYNDAHYGSVWTHAAVGARHQHGRRLGDAAAARARQRLDHRQARSGRHGRENRSRYRTLQGQLSRIAARCRRHCWKAPTTGRLPPSRCSGRSSWASRSSRWTASTPSTARPSTGPGSRQPREAQHLPGRRRVAAAHLRRTRMIVLIRKR